MKNGDLDELNDAMTVFDHIKGTPRYWQKIRTDMIAKIKQLGPFQFFFTLSCADKRWEENFISILTQLGHNVVFQKSGYTNSECQNFVFFKIPKTRSLSTHLRPKNEGFRRSISPRKLSINAFTKRSNLVGISFKLSAIV